MGLFKDLKKLMDPEESLKTSNEILSKKIAKKQNILKLRKEKKELLNKITQLDKELENEPR